MISYREALKQEFPQLTDVMIDKSGCCCPGNFFDGNNVPNGATCNENITSGEVCSRCWDKPCEGTYNGDPFDSEDWGCDSEEVQQTASDTDNTAGVPALAETTAVFDYSELDEQVADKLRKAAENVIAAKRKYVFEVAEQVKIAHDLLSNNRNGMFGAWCESVGISRYTGKNLLNIVELFNNITPEQTENLEQLKPYMLYEVAKPSAPPELVQSVLDGNLTTHKDYIAMKKQIKEQQERIDANKGAIKQLSEINAELEKENKELKSRPVEVAVQTDEKALAEKDEEIAHLRNELAEQKRLNETDDLFADAFNSKPTNNGSSEEQISAFYDVLIDKAKYALKDCVYFITDKNLSLGLRKKLTEKFHSFSDLLDMYYDDLEV